MPDRLRVVSNLNGNYRINPFVGTVLVDAVLSYAGGDANAGADPNVTAVAYINNFAGASTTTLYGIDTLLDVLLIQNPPNGGVLNTVGSLGINVGSAAGFDISTNKNLLSNTALAALNICGGG